MTPCFTLPVEQQREVLDFVEFKLHRRSKTLVVGRQHIVE